MKQGIRLNRFRRIHLIRRSRNLGDVPKIKIRQNPWQPREASKPLGPRCPYCGSTGTHPLKAFTADGFQQYRCGSCLKTFEKKL